MTNAEREKIKEEISTKIRDKYPNLVFSFDELNDMVFINIPNVHLFMSKKFSKFMWKIQLDLMNRGINEFGFSYEPSRKKMKRGKLIRRIQNIIYHIHSKITYGYWDSPFDEIERKYQLIWFRKIFAHSRAWKGKYMPISKFEKNSDWKISIRASNTEYEYTYALTDHFSIHHIELLISHALRTSPYESKFINHEKRTDKSKE